MVSRNDKSIVPGIAKCGDPPEIASPGIMVVKDMEAVYSCPEDLRLYGIEKRTCHEVWMAFWLWSSRCHIALYV